MSKLEIIVLSGVVYNKVKSTGPSTEPCGTPYESVLLSDRVSLILRIGLYLNFAKFHLVFQKLDHLTCNAIQRINRNEVSGFIHVIEKRHK